MSWQTNLTSNAWPSPSGMNMSIPESEPSEIGPITKGVIATAPFGTMGTLSSEQLRAEQLTTLATARRSYSLSAKLLFGLLDLVYGKGRNLEKFRVLELAARVPYQAWEHVAYVAVTHRASEPDFAGRIFTQVRSARREQDNEQWHLLILEELTAQRPRRYGWLRTVAFPQLLALGYYQLSFVLYALRPDWSYRLNADFEDHAEHEYASLVEENPEFESLAFVSQFSETYGSFASIADLFRQISYDERVHKLESVARMKSARFA
jgi:ubiquinol oxidase